MKIKEFDFGFENCEVMRFNEDNIECFNLSDIRTSIQYMNKDYAKQFNTAYHVFIILKPNANTEEHNSSFSGYGMDNTPFDRITRYNDITSIGVTFADENGIEKYEEYYPAYEDADWNGEENLRQLSLVSDKGYLILMINKDVKKNREKVIGKIKEDCYWLFDEPEDEYDDDDDED